MPPGCALLLGVIFTLAISPGIVVIYRHRPSVCRKHVGGWVWYRSDLCPPCNKRRVMAAEEGEMKGRNSVLTLVKRSRSGVV